MDDDDDDDDDDDEGRARRAGPGREQAPPERGTPSLRSTFLLVLEVKNGTERKRMQIKNCKTESSLTLFRCVSLWKREREKEKGK